MLPMAIRSTSMARQTEKDSKNSSGVTGMRKRRHTAEMMRISTMTKMTVMGFSFGLLVWLPMMFGARFAPALPRRPHPGGGETLRTRPFVSACPR
ncbi:MAG: hypothetical protein LC126_14575 [Bryobacterales bacterium]|nr:hypothetical protein [Bryobacterales bacterium]